MEFNRIILQTTDKSDITNNQENIVDPGHAKMLASGLYTQSQIDQMQSNSITFFNEKFGLNFANAESQPDGSGKIPIPGGLAFIIPYATGLDKVHRLTFDSENPQRGNSNNWYFETYGNIVLILASGTFTNCVYAGQTYAPTNILFYFDQNALKETNSRHNRREVFQIQSFSPSQTVVNSFGKSEQHAKFNIIDEDCNIGFGTLEIVINKDEGSNPITFSQKNRGVYTWY
jgi:hypothetical protein